MILKITGAWFVDDHATIGDKRLGMMLARTEDDQIYCHKERAFTNPRQFVQAVEKFGRINTDHWEFRSDDREAARYYDNHFEPDQPR